MGEKAKEAATTRRSDYFLVIERAAGGRAAGENKRKE